ncbi:MAG: diguanylate cyclase [Halothiobacillaceae bacterium]
MQYTALKWKYLSVIFLVIVVVVGTRVALDVRADQHALKEHMAQHQEAASDYLDSLVDGLRDVYLTLGAHYGTEPQFARFFATADRAGLQAFLAADYERLKALNPDLFVMHLFYPDNVTLLRMHRPDQHGDDLTDLRPIVAAVNADQQWRGGFEGGKNAVTYRVTMPLIDRAGRHFGTLEFGIRPEYFVRRLDEQFGVSSMVVVDAAEWRKQTRPGQTPRRWGVHYVVHGGAGLDGLLEEAATSEGRTVMRDGRHWLVLGDLTLDSFDGRPLARLVSLQDVTPVIREFRRDLLIKNGINLLALLGLLALIYAMFCRYGDALLDSSRRIRDLERQSARYRREAMKDVLTGLCNRRYFERLMNERLAEGATGSLLLIDVDHFKQINDRFGHETGDEILRELAAQMRAFFRQDDLVVRWGGEEFVVFLDQVDTLDGVVRAEQFRGHLADRLEVGPGQAVTVSIGVSAIESRDDRASLESAFRQADRRLYQAKQTGRNRVIGPQEESVAGMMPPTAT